MTELGWNVHADSPCAKREREGRRGEDMGQPDDQSAKRDRRGKFFGPH